VNKYIFVTFAFMGVSFYVLSGGADFVPDSRPVVADAGPVSQDRIDAVVAEVAAEEPAPAVVMASVVEPVAAVEPPAEDVASTGFVSLSESTTGFPEATESVPSSGITLTVIAQSLNVRGGPTTDAEVIDKLAQNEIVSVVQETDDGWALIRIEGDGVEGWVARRFLSE
jgi:hypothetical protein